MVKTEFPLVAVLPLVHCADCNGKNIVPNNIEDALLVTLEARVSATPKDRIAAMELSAKYGMGVLKEISVESVRERVLGTLEVIRSHVAPDLYQAMLPALRAQWA